ncbi:MAG: glycoside hydrolase family 3 C-terminal domain-containing protein [Clostridia bacterium]|nr:glycoside hydrolase family 3 C-terminal domain-containing protein [Clostridia bacterium]
MKKLLSFTMALLLAVMPLAACTEDVITTTGDGPSNTTNPPITTVNPPTTTKTPEVSVTPAEISHAVAVEGMVLLKNEDNVLPFTSDNTLAIFGQGQIDLVKGGGGSGDVVAEHVVGVLEGIEAKAKDGKVRIYEKLANNYKRNSSYLPTPSVMKTAKANADTAVMVISRRSGEGSDRSASKGDYYLSDSESNQLKNLVAAGFQDIVVILNVGGVIDTTELLSYPEVKAILVAWQPGQEGGHAIADLLVGDATPSGKLPDTFAKSYNDYPTAKNFHESVDYVEYTEDIFVGYRYFETFDPNYTKVNFPFGFGLSYTSFDYSKTKISITDGVFTAEVTVKNTGNYSGKEVIQVYFSAPQGKLGKAAMELCAFGKTSLLAPGEEETLRLTFALNDMAAYDDTGKVQKSAYILEKGDYKIFIGNSVRDAREKGVRFTHTLSETKVVEQLSEKVAANLLTKRLLANGSYETVFNDTNIGLPITKEPVKIEAEDYYGKHCHAEYVYNSNATKCGIKMLTSDAGNRYVTFAVEAAEDGIYRIALGLGNGGAAVNNAIRFYVNGAVQSGNSLNIPNTKGEWAIQEVGYGNVRLVKGLNFIKIEFTAGDSYQGILDYITVEYGQGSIIDTEQGNEIPVAANGITTVQGEAYTDCHSDVGTEEIAAGSDMGGTAVKNLHTTDYYVTYRLKAAATGTYRIKVRVANGLGDATNAATLVINGVLQKNFGYSIEYTGVEGNQWFVFKTVDAGTVTLQEGVNELTFTVVERMGNLDWFTLEKVDETLSSDTAPVLGLRKTITFDELCADPSLMDDFIAQLTVEEIAYLLHGHGESVPHGTGSIGGLVKYGIPSAETADGPAGINLYDPTTAYPIETLRASTWNTELLYQMGVSVGKEAVQYNVDIWLAPGMNIHRNPLCGRNFEYYSEDPFLTGMMASGLTKGVQSQNVGVTVKHFFGNEKETNRGYTDSRISERALREIYIEPFRLVIKNADPWCIMTSYNKVNGCETAENRELLTDIVRGEWNYQGLIMSDWWNDSIQSKELLAGQSLKMKSGQESVVLGAYKNGILSRETLELHAKYVIKLIMRSNAVSRVTEENCIEINKETVTTVRSIDATWRSDAIGMEVCKDVNGTYNTTNTYEGQWLVFVINVEEAGRYTFTFRVASTDGGGSFNILVDDVQRATFRNTLKTGDWQAWGESPNKVTVSLPAGTHQLKFAFTGGGFNLNTFDIEAQ